MNCVVLSNNNIIYNIYVIICEREQRIQQTPLCGPTGVQSSTVARRCRGLPRAGGSSGGGALR